MRRPEHLFGVLWRTAAFRLALWQAALCLIVVMAMSTIVNRRVAAYAQEDLRSEVATQMASLRLADAEGTLEPQLRRRVTDATAGPDYYLLLGQQGRSIIGNLRYVPSSTGWQTAPLVGAVGKDHDDADRVELYVDHLPDGRWLVVGRDDRSVVEFGEQLSHSLTRLAIVAVFLVLLGGGLTSWRYLSRIDLLGERAQRILGGEQDLVIEGQGRGDEIDRLAGRLNHMLARNKVLMDGMRQVCNDVAHDLRSPLIRVRQGLERCLAEFPPGAGRPAVRQALKDLDSVLATFAALLRISQVEARVRHAGFAEHDVSAVFRDVVETYRPVAEDADYVLQSDIEDSRYLSCDRPLIIQSLVNLIENALHHTPPGTVITVGLRQTGHILTGYVRDDGPGIPAEDRPRVIKRFVRLTSSRSTPGNGLGLALVSAVADLHRMELRLEDAAPGLKVVLACHVGTDHEEHAGSHREPCLGRELGLGPPVRPYPRARHAGRPADASAIHQAAAKTLDVPCKGSSGG